MSLAVCSNPTLPEVWFRGIDHKKVLWGEKHGIVAVIEETIEVRLNTQNLILTADRECEAAPVRAD